jgi:hypothetical protein
MATNVEFKVVNGPGLEDFLKSFRSKPESKIQVVFHLDYGSQISQISSVIDSICNPDGALEEWHTEGHFRDVLGEVEFSGKYNVHSRKGTFMVAPEDAKRKLFLEEHPVCGHSVPIGSRYCPQCGRDRQDVG